MYTLGLSRNVDMLSLCHSQIIKRKPFKNSGSQFSIWQTRHFSAVLSVIVERSSQMVQMTHMANRKAGRKQV